MKKIIYFLIATSIIGGVAYVLTQTGMLKGDLYNQTDTRNPDAIATLPTTDTNSGEVRDGDELSSNTITTDVDDDLEEVPSKKVDLSFGNVAYSDETNIFKVELCQTGELDASIKNVTYDYKILASDTSLIAQESITIEASELRAEACSTIEVTEKDLDSSSVTKWSVNMMIDSTEAIKESDEKNNTYEETYDFSDAAEETPSATETVTTGDLEEEEEEEEEATIYYACTDVTIDPDSFAYTVDDQSETVELTIKVDVAKETVSFWNSLGQYLSFLTWGADWLQALTLETRTDTYYSAVLVVETNGQGTLTDDQGNTGSSLEIPVSWDSKNIVLEHSLTYSDGSAGDIITAYIQQDQKCKDSLALQAPADPTEESYACTDIDVNPSSWDLTTDGTAFELNVTTMSNGSDWEGTLNVSVNGSGTLTNQEGSSGSSLDFTVSGMESVTSVDYSGATASDVITAKITGEDNCSENITISESTAMSESTVTDSSEDSSDDSSNTTTTTSDTTTSDSSTSSSDDDEGDYRFDSLTSEEPTCTETFLDVDSSDWAYYYIWRMFCTDIIQGRTSNTYFVPEGEMTRAEAVKVLMLLSGKTLEDAYGKTESFVDVDASHWAYYYFILAEEADVVRSRDSGGYAHPNDLITRGDFMLMMARTAEETLYGWDEDDIPFSDLTTSDYYTYAIIIGYETWVDDPDEGSIRVFEGYSNGTSGAKNTIARSEAMALALRFYLAYYAE